MRLAFVLTTLALLAGATVSQAATLKAEFVFSSGFSNVSVNGGAETATGSVTVTALLDTATPNSSSSQGLSGFALESLQIDIAALGVSSMVASPSPMYLIAYSSGICLCGTPSSNGDFFTGFNGGSSPGLGTVANVSALLTYQSITGYSSYFAGFTTLADGTTILARTGSGGAPVTVTFSEVATVPLPATLPLLLVAGGALLALRRRKQGMATGARAIA